MKKDAKKSKQTTAKLSTDAGLQRGATPGIERLPDGRRVCYFRTWMADYVATFYGTSDGVAAPGVSLLVSHKRRGTDTWSMVLDGFSMLNGRPSQILQGEWRRADVRWLFAAVMHARGLPDSLKDFRTENSAGTIIFDEVNRAIQSGNPIGIDRLRKCILAVNEACAGRTKRQNIAQAVCAAAQRINGIPHYKDALQDFSDMNGDGDEGNFVRGLRDAGFGWILARSCKKS